MGNKIRNKGSKFVSICRNKFKFLVVDFGFKIFSTISRTNYEKIIFIKDHLGFSLCKDNRDLEIYACFIKIPQDHVMSEEIFINEPNNRYVFSLQDLVKKARLSIIIEKYAVEDLFVSQSIRAWDDYLSQICEILYHDEFQKLLKGDLSLLK